MIFKFVQKDIMVNCFKGFGKIDAINLLQVRIDQEKKNFSRTNQSKLRKWSDLF